MVEQRVMIPHYGVVFWYISIFYGEAFFLGPSGMNFSRYIHSQVDFKKVAPPATVALPAKEVPVVAMFWVSKL